MPKQSPESYERMASTTAQNRAVERYLSWITTGTLPLAPNQDAALEALRQKIDNEDKLYRKAVLIAQRHAMESPAVDQASLEDEFVKQVRGFSERNAVGYAVWREMGVPAKVLTRAGFTRTTLTKSTAEPRDPDRPRQTRNKMTPEFAARFLAVVDSEGEDAAAEQFGYAPHYAKDLARRLRKTG